MEEKGFKRLISSLPKGSVLDVGCGGLEGENTTDYLVEYFGVESITGVCKWKKDIDKYRLKVPEINIIETDYYGIEFNEKFDLVVLDLNIENNLKDWTDEGLKRTSKLVKKDGVLINYVMMTDAYGDPNETPQMIRDHRKNFWESDEWKNEMVGARIRKIKGFKLLGVEREERRPYIYWVALQKI